MGLAGILVGPFAAAIGLVAVFFVMRHRSVQTKSMYSARRGQIERKVRAARQRTLAPTGKHTEKDETAAAAPTLVAPGMEGKTAVPTATWGPTAAPSTPPTFAPAPPAAEPAWEVGPTVPPPPPFTPAPAPPPFAPAEPAYEPPPPPVAPAEEWVPAAIQPVAPAFPEPMAAPAEPASTPAGGGASWSIVGDSKSVAAEPDAGKKKGKKDKQAQTSSWTVTSGMPGDEGEEIKRPSAAMAIAQYLVLVVGLIMVLIGVVVMVANSHVT
jgi:hypothetical protein